MCYHWEDTDERLTCRITRRRLSGQCHFCLQRILTTGNRRIRQLESVWFGIADFCGSPPALRSSTDKVSLNKEKKRTQTQFSKGGPCWAQHRHRPKTSISHFPLFFPCYMNIYSHYYIARNVLSSLRDLMMGQKILASEASLYINKEDVLYSDGENGRSTKETQVRHSQFRASGVAQLGIRCRPGLREGDDRQDSRALGGAFHTVSWSFRSRVLLLSPALEVSQHREHKWLPFIEYCRCYKPVRLRIILWGFMPMSVLKCVWGAKGSSLM